MEDLRVQDPRIGDVESRNFELLKHDFCHLFSMSWGIPTGFGDEDGVFYGIAA